MNIVTTVRGALVACLFGAALLTATPHAAATPIPAGRCLLGHVNANPNSACRGSDSANWPRVPADPNGNPLEECGPANDGRTVSTEDVHGGQHGFICQHVTNVRGEEYWEWNEVLIGGRR